MSSLTFSSLTIQVIGTLLLTLMLAQLGRAFGRGYARRWSIGFAFLSFGLTALYGFFHLSVQFLWAVYLVCEWVWLLMLWAGCRELVTGSPVDLKQMRFALPMAIVAAIVMATVTPSFHSLFMVQAGIVSAGLFFSFGALGGMPSAGRDAGWWTMRTMLFLQGVVFAGYVPLFAYQENVRRLEWATYSSVIDLFIATCLGFGMVLTAAEETNRVLNAALSRLDDRRSQLEVRLQTDPLTEALSRHAFYSMQRGDEIDTAGELHGVVVMIDVDNLKQINDEIGHAAGDVVIRSSANAVRQMIRADDLLFRWGGDEFVAILPNSTLEAVDARLKPLEDGVIANISADHPQFRFRVTWGAAEFGSTRTLDEAIRIADAAMYEKRRVEDEATAS